MSTANKALIESLYAAVAQGDIPTFFGAMDPQIVWTEAENFLYADRNPYVGPQQIGDGVFGRLLTEWSGFTVTPEQMVADDESVAVVGRYAGTNNATGVPVHAQFVHVWTIREGRITRFQQFTDTLQFARASQAIPA